MMTKVCEKMNISVSKIIDGNDKEVGIAGCVEVKGIRGHDKRCYLVDLQGMTPRDANFLGEENHTCLVRQELLVLYQRHLAYEAAKALMEDFNKEQEAELKEKLPKIEEGKEPAEEQLKHIQALRMEYTTKKVRKFEGLVKDQKPVVFNCNVFKNVKLAVSAEELKSEEEKVRDLCKYLKEKAIPNLIQNLQKTEGQPTDSATLREFFH